MIERGLKTRHLQEADLTAEMKGLPFEPLRVCFPEDEQGKELIGVRGYEILSDVFLYSHQWDILMESEGLRLAVHKIEEIRASYTDYQKITFQVIPNDTFKVHDRKIDGEWAEYVQPYRWYRFLWSEMVKLRQLFKDFGIKTLYMTAVKIEELMTEDDRERRRLIVETQRMEQKKIKENAEKKEIRDDKKWDELGTNQKEAVIFKDRLFDGEAISGAMQMTVTEKEYTDWRQGMIIREGHGRQGSMREYEARGIKDLI